MEKESIYDEAEITEELPTEEETTPDEEEFEEWNPQILDESPKEKLERKGVKENADGKTLTIKEVFFTRPRLKDKDGQPIPPKESTDGPGRYYTGKMGIRFEEDNLVEYYPNLKYFVNEVKGKDVVSKTVKIWREGNNEISKLFKLALPLLKKPEDEISDADFFKFLIGKKVKIKVSKGTYNKKDWFRNDIVLIAFV